MSNDTAFEEVAEALEQYAAHRDTVTYNDFALKFGFPPVNNHFSNHPLKLFFEQIDADDAREHRPFRTAVVVQKATARPGDGFFRSLKMHRDKDATTGSETSLWEREFEALQMYYAPGQPKHTLQVEVSAAQAKRLNTLAAKCHATPEDLTSRAFTNLLEYLEQEFAALDEAKAQSDGGETRPHEEVFAKICSRLRRKR